MAEWNMAPDITIPIKGFAMWQVPIAITLISEKLFNGHARLSKARRSDPRVE